MKIKGAIFDFDGTLFDSMFIWDNVGADYLRSVGKTPEENLTQVLSPMSLSQAACYLKEKYELSQTLDEIMSGAVRLVRDFYYDLAQPKEGVMEFLIQLKKNGVKMCIATATERSQIEAALKRCNMDRFFSEIFTCTDVGHGKDEPVIFRKAAECLQTKCSETAVFEDAFHAAETAKKDGFPVVAVYDDHEKRQEEIRALADCFLEDFQHPDSFWKFASE